MLLLYEEQRRHVKGGFLLLLPCRLSWYRCGRTSALQFAAPHLPTALLMLFHSEAFLVRPWLSSS